MWSELYKANKGAKLTEGTTLVPLPRRPMGCDEVQDHFERNADRLVSTNTIYEGQVIVLPAK